MLNGASDLPLWDKEPEDLAKAAYHIDHIGYQVVPGQQAKAIFSQRLVGVMSLRYFAYQNCSFRAAHVTAQGHYTIVLYLHQPGGRVTVAGKSLESFAGAVYQGGFRVIGYGVNSFSAVILEIPKTLLENTLARAGIDLGSKTYDPFILLTEGRDPIIKLRNLLISSIDGTAPNDHINDTILRLCTEIASKEERSFFDYFGSYHTANQTLDALDRLKSNPGPDLQLGRIASNLGLGRRQLERAFISTFGISPARHHREMRLSRIRQALASGESGYGDIVALAKREGFGNPGNMAKYFYLIYGEKPRDYVRRKTEDSRN